MLSYSMICDLKQATGQGKQKMGIISDKIRVDHGCKGAGDEFGELEVALEDAAAAEEVLSAKDGDHTDVFVV